MNRLSYSIIASVLILVINNAAAQSQVISDYSTLPNSPAYEEAAYSLRSEPANQYRFQGARLTDVLQLLAEECGISFFALPAGNEAGDQIVTFTIHASPFLALETLTKANGISLIHENGIWYLRPANDTHLIGRVYLINYNSREVVTASSSGSGGLGQVSGGTTGGGTTGGGSSIDLQGSTASFEVEPSQLLEDVRELLDIPAEAAGVIAGVTSVDQLSQGNGGASSIVLPSSIASGVDNTSGQGSKVVWISDSNSLYVVATRQQHQWIEGYLSASDKPQDQIALEVKFIETSRDPRSEFGVDWSGTMADGYDVVFSGDPTGTATGASNFTNAANPRRLGDFELPTTGVVNLEFVQAKIRAFATDSESRTVSYPRMLTTNNREVMLRSVVNQPVLASTSATSLGAGATTTQSVSYLPIGTVLNILPKRMGNGKIQLNIALTISSIIGEEIINGNPFPIASSRVYNAPVEVDPGYTVAIGGLDEANWNKSEVGIPALRNIPLAGFLFNSRSGGRQRNSLMIMITPNVIDSKSGGLPDEPISIKRVKPNQPAATELVEDGTLIRNIEELRGVVVSLEHECELLEQQLAEYTPEEETKVRLAELVTGTRETRRKLREWAEASPSEAPALAGWDAKLLQLQERIARVQRKARWMLY